MLDRIQSALSLFGVDFDPQKLAEGASAIVEPDQFVDGAHQTADGVKKMIDSTMKEGSTLDDGFDALAGSDQSDG